MPNHSWCYRLVVLTTFNQSIACIMGETGRLGENWVAGSSLGEIMGESGRPGENWDAGSNLGETC